MDSSEAYNLQRFLRAQESVYDQVCDELTKLECHKNRYRKHN